MASFAEGLLSGARQFTGGMSNLVNAGETLERRKRERELAPIRKQLLENQAAQGQENLRQSQARGAVLDQQLRQGMTLQELAIGRGQVSNKYQEAGLQQSLDIGSEALRQSKIRGDYLEPQLSQNLRMGEQNIRRGDQQYELGELGKEELEMRLEDLPGRYSSARKARTVQDYQLDKQIKADELEQVETDIVKALRSGTGNMTQAERDKLEPMLRDYAERKGVSAAHLINKFGQKEDAEAILNHHLGEGNDGVINPDGSVTIMDKDFNQVNLPKNWLESITKDAGVESFDPITGTARTADGRTLTTQGSDVTGVTNIPNLSSARQDLLLSMPSFQSGMAVKKNENGTVKDMLTGKNVKMNDAFFMNRKTDVDAFNRRKQEAIKQGIPKLQMEFELDLQKQRLSHKYKLQEKGTDFYYKMLEKQAGENGKTYETGIWDEWTRSAPLGADGKPMAFNLFRKEYQERQKNPNSFFQNKIAAMDNAIAQRRSDYENKIRKQGWFDWGTPNDIVEMENYRDQLIGQYGDWQETGKNPSAETVVSTKESAALGGAPGKPAAPPKAEKTLDQEIAEITTAPKGSAEWQKARSEALAKRENPAEIAKTAGMNVLKGVAKQRQEALGTVATLMRQDSVKNSIASLSKYDASKPKGSATNISKKDAWKFAEKFNNNLLRRTAVLTPEEQRYFDTALSRKDEGLLEVLAQMTSQLPESKVLGVGGRTSSTELSSNVQVLKDYLNNWVPESKSKPSMLRLDKSPSNNTTPYYQRK